MTKEERAEIARKNGAKSKGPKTQAGKTKSARNALKDGTYAEKFGHFVPVHHAVICHEDRQEYMELVDELIAIYHPCNQAAFSVIRDMATARWQIDRLQRCIIAQWNCATIEANRTPSTLAPELHDMHCISTAVATMLSGNNLLSKMNREIERLQQSLARAERRIKFINANFPDAAPILKRTQQNEDAPIENKELTTDTDENQQPIYITENVPSVIAAYRAEFPGRQIVILPPEPIDDFDSLPPIPRLFHSTGIPEKSDGR